MTADLHLNVKGFHIGESSMNCLTHLYFCRLTPERGRREVQPLEDWLGQLSPLGLDGTEFEYVTMMFLCMHQQCVLLNDESSAIFSKRMLKS